MNVRELTVEVEYLRQQNTDLMAVIRNLSSQRTHVNVKVDLSDPQYEAYAKLLTQQASYEVVNKLVAELEDRRDLYRTIADLKYEVLRYNPLRLE